MPCAHSASSQPDPREDRELHYVIHCLDHSGAVQKRLDHYEAHKAYLGAARMKTVISGPLLADDEQTCQYCPGWHGLVGQENALGPAGRAR